MRALLPTGYVSVREAAEIIARSMFAGVPDRPLVVRFRKRGWDVSGRNALDDAIAELWKGVDANKVRAMAIGGRPRRIVRLTAGQTQEVPILRNARGRDFTYLRPSNPPDAQFTAWFGVNIAEIILAFREREIERFARSMLRARRRKSASDGGAKRIGRPSRQAAVKAAIRVVIERRQWSPPKSLKLLTQVVNRQGKWPYPVSDDTVTRALDQLH